MFVICSISAGPALGLCLSIKSTVCGILELYMEETSTTPLLIEPARHDATHPDMSRHTFTIKQSADRFASLGVPRSPRSVQRFCELGNLDCIRVKGEKTERYFVDPQSVERYAEELRQLENISHLGIDMSRHDASYRVPSRHDATCPFQAGKYFRVAEAPPRIAPPIGDRQNTARSFRL